MSAGFLLGLDLGTSGVKAVLLPESDGTSVSATVELQVSTPHPGWSEQDPDDWWQATAAAIRQTLDRSKVDASCIAAVACSGQMHGATLLDAQGNVLRPCILWNDQRSGEECRIITEQVGLDRLLSWVGNPALAGFTAPKVLWVRAHEPEVYARTATVLLPKDYLNYRLTGEMATEPSDASGTLLFDVVNRRWSDSLTGALDIPLALLPPVHASTDVIGRITPEASEATGLRPGTPVVAGGADNACAAVGMGVVTPGQVLASLGTSGTLVAPTAEPRVDVQGRLHTFCHAVPDAWYLMGVVLSAGGSLRWFRDALGEPERATAEESGRDPYELLMEEAAQAPAGSDGLICLPYLTGERTPHGDPYARGVFFGLSLRHGRSHVVRAVVEGVSYALGDSARLMRDLEVNLDTVRATGGGARSALWRQILADVLDTRLVTASSDAGPALGAAILAGVGAGVWSSISEACNRLVTVSDQVFPNKAEAAVYRRYQELYDSLYPDLKQAFTRLAVDEGA